MNILGKQNFLIVKEDIYFYNNVKNINISYNIVNKDLEDNDNFIIKIIPLKDIYKYTICICNENYKIISLIQKTIIYYLLSLFKDIHIQINTYNKNENEINKNKIYQTELFKFISIQENNEIIKDIKDDSPALNELNKKLENIFHNKDNNYHILNDDLT